MICERAWLGNPGTPGNVTPGAAPGNTGAPANNNTGVNQNMLSMEYMIQTMMNTPGMNSGLGMGGGDGSGILMSLLSQDPNLLQDIQSGNLTDQDKQMLVAALVVSSIEGNNNGFGSGNLFGGGTFGGNPLMDLLGGGNSMFSTLL